MRRRPLSPLLLIFITSLLATQSISGEPVADLDLARLVGRPGPENKFSDPDYYIWCGSMVAGPDGKYHLFYSRWPRVLGHAAWVTHSEVAHAVADSPAGPYRH